MRVKSVCIYVYLYKTHGGGMCIFCMSSSLRNATVSMNCLFAVGWIENCVVGGCNRASCIRQKYRFAEFIHAGRSRWLSMQTPPRLFGFCKSRRMSWTGFRNDFFKVISVDIDPSTDRYCSTRLKSCWISSAKSDRLPSHIERTTTTRAIHAQTISTDQLTILESGIVTVLHRTDRCHIAKRGKARHTSTLVSRHLVKLSFLHGS